MKQNPLCYGCEKFKKCDSEMEHICILSKWSMFKGDKNGNKNNEQKRRNKN